MTLKPPPDLGKAGRSLWSKVTGTLVFDDPRETISLRQACLLEDDLARVSGLSRGGSLCPLVRGCESRRRLYYLRRGCKGFEAEDLEEPVLGG